MASEPTLFGTLEPVGGGDPIPLYKERIKIGRREICDVRLPFSNVSSEHCELILEQGFWKLRDLQSANGTKVNGERVLEKRVYPNDEISISKHKFRIAYTPTTSRSADAEVDELHEDIMRISLLERAGLSSKDVGLGDRDTKRDIAAYDGKRVRPKSAEDEALELLNAAPPRPAPPPDADAVVIARPDSGVDDDDVVDTITPATSAHNLSDDEFLKMVEDDPKKTPKKPK